MPNKTVIQDKDGAVAYTAALMSALPTFSHQIYQATIDSTDLTYEDFKRVSEQISALQDPTKSNEIVALVTRGAGDQSLKDSVGGALNEVVRNALAGASFLNHWSGQGGVDVEGTLKWVVENKKPEGADIQQAQAAPTIQAAGSGPGLTSVVAQFMNHAMQTVTDTALGLVEINKAGDGQPYDLRKIPADMSREIKAELMDFFGSGGMDSDHAFNKNPAMLKAIEASGASAILKEFVRGGSNSSPLDNITPEQVADPAFLQAIKDSKSPAK